MHRLAEQVLGFEADDGNLLGHLDSALRAGHGEVPADSGGPADDAHRLRQRLDPAAAVVLPRLQAGPGSDPLAGLVDDRLDSGLLHHEPVDVGPEVDELALRAAFPPALPRVDPRDALMPGFPNAAPGFTRGELAQNVN